MTAISMSDVSIYRAVFNVSAKTALQVSVTDSELHDIVCANSCVVSKINNFTILHLSLSRSVDPMNNTRPSRPRTRQSKSSKSRKSRKSKTTGSGKKSRSSKSHS